MRLLVLAAAALPLVAGCGASAATVKGRLVSNGEPLTVPPFVVAVTLTPLGGGGKGPSFTSPVNGDGTFEVVVSGGELPPGEYRVSIVATGKLKDKFKSLAGDQSPVRRELKPGPNDLTIDVVKPQG